MRQKRKWLFLHMGPGLNAGVEANIFANRFPEMEFWNQPALHETEGAFSRLIKASTQKVEELAKYHGPIGILGHSFGAHIAHGILERVPHLVSSCQFISPCYDLKSGFLNVLKALRSDPQTDKDHKEEINRILKDVGNNPDNQQFWDVVQCITQDPDFLRLYWSSQQCYQWYVNQASQCSPLDFPTFSAVLTDFLHAPAKNRLNWKNKLYIFIGDNDPFLTSGASVYQLWSQVFDNVSVETINDTGHFPHLVKDTPFLRP